MAAITMPSFGGDDLYLYMRETVSFRLELNSLFIYFFMQIL